MRLAAVLLCALCSLQLGAATITLQVVGLDSYRSMTVAFLADGDAMSARIGVVNIRLEGVSRKALCVDLFTSVSGTLEVNAYHPDRINQGGRIAWLFANHMPSSSLPVSERQVLGAALQLAAWDIVHDSGDGFASGRVMASTGTSAAVLVAANDYLTASKGQWSGLGTVYISAYPPLRQALMSSNMGPEWPTPEPSGLLAGLGGLGLITIRRFRANRGGADRT
jgi:hypothetical protein